MSGFYELSEKPGNRVNLLPDRNRFSFVDQASVREKLVDFSDERTTRVTFRLPTIHCVACVWLLENLFRLNPGIGEVRVNFLRKEASICFTPSAVQLSQVIALLASIGYEPDLKLADLSVARKGTARGKKLWLQAGLAGFAFGNTMLFSIASYVGLDSGIGPEFERLVGLISLLLAIPVVTFSAQEYWRSAWLSLRQRTLNIDVPIALGILALFGESCHSVLIGHGPGYFDSLAGLLFFLLCGRIFQEKTFDSLAFDRDFRAFFPLGVTRAADSREESVSLSQVQIDDVLVIRNGELIPADACLLSEKTLVDYSFVTGEATPVAKRAGEYLYAGGRQVGGAIHVKTVKPVSQGYLTSLWNQPAFQKREGTASLQKLIDRYSQRFTRMVIAVAVGAALFWGFVNPSLSLKAFTAVLIVACPCALALATPFALGTAQRILARRQVFLKNSSILESLAAADSIVFDKTGTLTAATGVASFEGVPLSVQEAEWCSALALQSTHPHCRQIIAQFDAEHQRWKVDSFREEPGCGVLGIVQGRQILFGSAAWLRSQGVCSVPSPESIGESNVPPAAASVVHLAIDGTYRGHFSLARALRPDAHRLLPSLARQFRLTLLSGDNEKDADRFRPFFNGNGQLHFHQSPLDKLNFVRKLQRAGHRVVMVGDGLNDAGALQQSDAGIAVVENLSSFSPASDVIMSAGEVSRLDAILRFARASLRVVQLSIALSSLYNLVGISIAARGLLSPVVCAVLMPLSSATVVLFACCATQYLGRHLACGRAGQFEGKGEESALSAAVPGPSSMGGNTV